MLSNSAKVLRMSRLGVVRLAILASLLAVPVWPAFAQIPGSAAQPFLVQFGQRRLGNRPRVDGRLPGQRPGGLPRLNQQQKQQLQKRLMQAIGLSPDQSQRMQQIRRDHEEERIAAGRRLRQARLALDRTIMNEHYDEAAVRRATEELAEAQADKVRLESRIRSQIRGVLTPDQVNRFHQLERELRREMREQNQQQQQDREREQGALDLLDITNQNH